ncbi:unnamed protein product [Cuscuta campestris]|uniref:mannose-6-phosphate isomerase n=1 Tax=Cuscuta campestris TaxID=132261 RepID=A0A484NK96_9ASTE|nr:unnamed protein product [Cuscuta campestris]
METDGFPGAIPENTLLRLRCSVKNYDWGRIGLESRAARLYSLNTGEEVREDMPYAEFWMGTHDSGPAYVAGPVTGGGKENDSLTLKDLIRRNPTLVGKKVVRTWGPDLPFLFKVLSVAKALSIQAHPDKELAARLHKEQPEVYKDDNHKPEMALAITDFEALCGFISFEELKLVIQTVPEIREVVGSVHVEEVLHVNAHEMDENAKPILQSLFTTLMSASSNVVSQALTKLISRLNIKREARELTDKEQLVLRLEKQYPGDVGVIAAFLFNHVKLSPGEALYLGANEPHAYLFGECIECMATSDNVVRAGLTPKNRDVKTLCSMLTYNQVFPEILKGDALGPYTKRYSPPFDEFEVDHCALPRLATTVFPAAPGPSIFVIMTGDGTMSTRSSNEAVSEGHVLFAPVNTSVTVSTTATGLSLFRAGVRSCYE